jgi:hypothetical protein
MKEDITSSDGVAVTDEKIAEWEAVLENDEWPEGWENVGDVLEGTLPDIHVDNPEYERALLQQVKDYRSGRLETYSLEEVKQRCGLNKTKS